MYIHPQLLITYIVSYLSLLTSFFFFVGLLEKKRVRKKVKKFPKISILIPAHNEEENIIRTLNSVKNLNYPKNKIEIIVIDDGSTDNTYELVKRFGKGVKVYRKKQGGKASALNFGVKKCRGEYILCLDADCTLEKNFLRKVVKYLSKKVIAVAPSIKPLNRRKFFEKMQQIEYTLANYLRKIIWSTSSMFLVPGASFIKASFLKKNKFDVGNLTEDLEMGFKILKKGYEIAHATQAFCYTKVPSNFKKLMKQRIRWTYGYLYNLKKYGFSFCIRYTDLAFFILPMILVGIAISCFLLIYTISSTLYSSVKIFYYSSLIGFELTPQIIKFEFENFLNSILNEQMYFNFLLFLIGLTFYFLAQKELNERFKLYYFIYFLIYGWILFFFNLIAILFFISGKKPKW